MRYLLNIGNTRTAVGVGVPGSDGFAMEFHSTVGFGEAWSPSAPDGGWHAVAASVVPSARRALEARFPGRFHFISAEDFPWIDCSAYDMPRLGADRLANIAAAHRLSPGRAVLVIDCGTALNSVCVSPDGRFLGGVILPGRGTALRSLAKDTAQLPEFSVAATHELNPLGLTSEDAIRNGVDIGILGAAEAIVRKTRALPEMRGCRVWFTGGDAPFFAEYLPRDLEAEVAPLPLTLYGVSLADVEKAGRQ